MHLSSSAASAPRYASSRNICTDRQHHCNQSQCSITVNKSRFNIMHSQFRTTIRLSPTWDFFRASLKAFTTMIWFNIGISGVTTKTRYFQLRLDQLSITGVTPYWANFPFVCNSKIPRLSPTNKHDIPRPLTTKFCEEKVVTISSAVSIWSITAW